MWQELIDQKAKWIGGKLIDYGDSIDRIILREDEFPLETKILGFELNENWFGVIGKDFKCGGSRKHVCITDDHVENGLAIVGYEVHRFNIVRHE